MLKRTCLNCKYAAEKMFYTKDEKECYFYCKKFDDMFYEDIESPVICKFYQEKSNKNRINDDDDDWWWTMW